jgi:hypothetical protein
MAISQISGTITTGVTLTSAAYANPVTVTATGSVSGASDGTALYAATNWIIYNFGSIAGNGGAGIVLEDGGTVGNESGGSISGAYVQNSRYDQWSGIDISGASGAVDNSGTISGGHDGVDLAAGGTVANSASGAIYGGYAGIYVKDAVGSVINSEYRDRHAGRRIRHEPRRGPDRCPLDRHLHDERNRIYR